MNIIFFGTPAFTIPVIEDLKHVHTISAVVTTPDQKVGRKQLLTPTPVKQYATENNITVFTPERLTDETGEPLTKMKTDLMIVASYGKIIPQSILDIPTFGAINIHPSLLPKYRGASPIPSTLLSGDEIGGVTLIKMDAELDHGPIIAQQKYDIKHTDTTESLLPLLFKMGSELLTATIHAYVSGTLRPVAQNHNEATYCSRFTKEDAFLDIHCLPDKKVIDRMIRAYTPWPVVWSKVMVRGQEIRIKFYPDMMVQLEGSVKMHASELINGYPELKEILSSVLLFV